MGSLDRSGVTGVLEVEVVLAVTSLPRRRQMIPDTLVRAPRSVNRPETVELFARTDADAESNRPPEDIDDAISSARRTGCEGHQEHPGRDAELCARRCPPLRAKSTGVVDDGQPDNRTSSNPWFSPQAI
jgi:hypothetical protein